MLFGGQYVDTINIMVEGLSFTWWNAVLIPRCPLDDFMSCRFVLFSLDLLMTFWGRKNKSGVMLSKTIWSDWADHRRRGRRLEYQKHALFQWKGWRLVKIRLRGTISHGPQALALY